MRRRRVTLEIITLGSGSAVPAGYRHPLRLALHPIERLGRKHIVKANAALVVAAPDDGGETVEGADHNQYVIAGRGHVAGVEAGAFRRQVGNDDRPRTT